MNLDPAVVPRTVLIYSVDCKDRGKRRLLRLFMYRYSEAVNWQRNLLHMMIRYLKAQWEN